MNYLTSLSVVALSITLAGCGPSKSQQAKTAMLAEIKQSNAEQGDAIRARCAQLGAAADLLQNPTVTSAVPANTNFEFYPEFFSGGPWAEAAKTVQPGETVRVAVVRASDLDMYSSTDSKNASAEDLTFLCRPLGFYFDVAKVKKALTDPNEFSDIENYRRLRGLLLGTRFVLALQQLDYQDGSLDAGSGASVFTPGHVAFRAVLIDLDGPAVLAIGEGEATNSDQIETHFRYKDDGSNDKDEAARKAAEDGLREDLRKHTFAALQQTLQSMVAGQGTPVDQQLGPDGKLHEVMPSVEGPGDAPRDSKLSDPFPSDATPSDAPEGSKLSEPNPDTKVP